MLTLYYIIVVALKSAHVKKTSRTIIFFFFFLPVNSPSTVGTWSNSSLRSSSFLATLRSSRGQASSSEVVFNMTNPRGARAGVWISCEQQLRVTN